jgi:hypothetical protein
MSYCFIFSHQVFFCFFRICIVEELNFKLFVIYKYYKAPNVEEVKRNKTKISVSYTEQTVKSP